METAEKLITENLKVWTSAVKAKSSAGRGSNNKRELYGIQKLRELILDLAVQGLLVPQNSEDEPAIEHCGLFGSGSELKAPFELPPIWTWSNLEQIATINGGFAFKSSDYSDDGIRVVRISDFDENGFKNEKIVRHSFSPELEKFSLRDGDILMAMTGGTVGKSLHVKALVEPMLVNQRVASIRASEAITSNYLNVLIQSEVTQKVIHEAKNSTNDNISMRDIKGFLVPLPPLAEQHRIVAKVDELMALCDQLEKEQESSLDTHDTLVATLLGALTTATADAGQFTEAWQRIQANFDTLFTTESSIDQLKQTILQLAVMGKLVPQDPEDESAVTTLERIATRRAKLIKAGDLKKRKLLPPIPKNEEPSKLPVPWQWCQLDVLITDMDAGWSPACPPTPSPSHDIWGVLKTTAVQVMVYRESENKVLDGGKSPRPQYEVKTGDILITRAGPKNRVGISCLVENTRPRLMISDKIIRFHLVEVGISERFISLCLNAGPTWNYLESAKSGMAESQMNISQGKLRAAPIPLAPIDEQRRIVAKVDELMALCDQLKASLATVQTTQLNLADSLVDAAIN